MDSNSIPPLEEAYEALKEKGIFDINELVVVEEYELPVIDVSRLDEQGEIDRMVSASKEWGFFEVAKHEFPSEVVNRLRVEQEKLFNLPFDKKTRDDNFSAGSYRWGTPTATCITHFSWSEAFHIPLTTLTSGGPNTTTTLTSTMEEFASNAHSLAQRVANILAEKMGQKSTLFLQENCLPTTSYLRLNRYPPCPVASHLPCGLVPHTDSSFLTILCQDHVRGLQLMKDGKWIAVKPNPHSLILNIGDLFQAWSNGVYKSVEHRVVTNQEVERFSVAYFFCPFEDTIIKSSCREHPVYRDFSYGEYRKQVRDDVQNLGTKVGLPKFLIHHH